MNTFKIGDFARACGGSPGPVFAGRARKAPVGEPAKQARVVTAQSLGFLAMRPELMDDAEDMAWNWRADVSFTREGDVVLWRHRPHRVAVVDGRCAGAAVSRDFIVIRHDPQRRVEGFPPFDPWYWAAVLAAQAKVWDARGVGDVDLGDVEAVEVPVLDEAGRDEAARRAREASLSVEGLRRRELAAASEQGAAIARELGRARESFRLGDFADAYAAGEVAQKWLRRGEGFRPLVLSGERIDRRADDAGAEHPVLTARAFDGGAIDEAAVERRRLSPKTPAASFTREGDVVVSMRGREVACVDSQHAGMFASNAFLVVRFDPARAHHVEAGGFPPFDPWYWTAALGMEDNVARRRGESGQASVGRFMDCRIPILDDEGRALVARLAREAAGRRLEYLRRVRAETGSALPPLPGLDAGAAVPTVRISAAMPRWLAGAIDAEAANLALDRKEVVIMWLAEKARSSGARPPERGR